MIRSTIIISRKYFSNYVTQSNYLIIQAKLLTVLFKNNIETNIASLLKHRNDFFLKEKLCSNTVKRYAEKICWLSKSKKLAWDWQAKKILDKVGS